MIEATAHIETDCIGTAVMFQRGGYSERIPFELMDSRIRFYRKLCDPRSPSARFYRSSLEALERARDEMGAQDV